MELVDPNLHIKHLLIVFGASVVAGIFVVLIDGYVIAPAERAIFGVVNIGQTVTAA
jgi:hypothetical protein